MEGRLSTGRKAARIALYAVAVIAIAGGALQMALGAPEATARLDNVHRFLAGVYLGVGFICLWAAATIRRQDSLVGLIGLGVLLSAVGRLVSMAIVGLPEPSAPWIAYLVVELALAATLGLAWLRIRRE